MNKWGCHLRLMQLVEQGRLTREAINLELQGKSSLQQQRRLLTT
jgi:hypothetical protein